MCLNMIVKDESHIIRQTLAMLCSKIRFDYWVICDTGSTDNTREIITDFFAEMKIKGELHCDKWVDFGHNRTLALERAFNKTDLLLVFDADDEIHGTINVPTEVLFDEYHLKFGAAKSGTNYTRTQIINNHKRFKYLSVLHEFISCQEPTPARSCILEGDYYLVSGRSGARNKDPDKYLKDAIILEKAHAVALASGDHLYKRYAFYCANSYRDCGRFEDAIKWYKITLSQDNWLQEKYVSCLYMYNCYEALKKAHDGFFYLVKAFSYDNERVECLYPLIVHYCCENMNEMAYNYFKMVKMTVPQNNAGKLFVETEKAGFYVPYYMIIVADRVGDRECGIQMYETIFKEKHRTFSVWHLKNLMFNLRFFINHVKPEAVNAFASLANEYLKFVIENGVPANTFDGLTIKITPNGSTVVSLPPNVSMREKAKAKETFKTSRNVLFYTGYCNKHWNYTEMKLGALGGSEKAVAHLSKELGLALDGMTIYVAGNVMAEKLPEFNVEYVTLDDLPKLLNNTQFHTVICSRYISFLEIYGNACSFHQFYIWAHDTCLLSYGSNMSDAAIIEKWSECIDGCVCQTQWHADRYVELYPPLKSKMNIINNGIDLQLFPAPALKQRGKFIYTSRTERGLARILELWPDVVGVLPNATLVVSTYEAFPCNDDEKRVQARIESLNREYPDNCIQHLGKLNPTQLYSEMSTAEFWLYPTNWPETSCITAMEMLMSEVICLYHPLAGLTDTMNGCGIQIVPGTEVNALREIAHDEERKKALRIQGRAYAESCSWVQRAYKWKQTLMKNNVAIFNSFEFHYELFGHILAHFARSNDASSITIFTETKKNMGWLDFYKTQFNHLNIAFKPVSSFCEARHTFDLIFITTDDDFAFKREWFNQKCIVSDHHVSNRRPECMHHIGLRPFVGNDKRWALPCYDLVSVNEKLRLLEVDDCIHIAITVGWQIVLNYGAINRLCANLNNQTKLQVHFIGRRLQSQKTPSSENPSFTLRVGNPTETVKNKIYYLDEKSDWILATSSNNANKLVSFASGVNSYNDGMWSGANPVKLDIHVPGNIGSAIYLSTIPGEITTVPPLVGIVRSVGYKLSETSIVFETCNDFASSLNSNIQIHLHEQMDTMQMIELLRKCDYVMTDLQNDDHINGITMSGVVPLSFSTLSTLIISKQNNQLYGFKNVVEFEMNSDEPIVLSKNESTHVEQLKLERDKLVGMYDEFIESLQPTICKNAVIANSVKKYCFIHSCNIENVGTHRLEHLIQTLKLTACENIFDKVFIYNIGVPIENEYGVKYEVVNYSDDIKLFETPTINALNEFSKTHPDSYILYLHTKGVRYLNDNQCENDWINMMLYFLVEEHKQCISILNDGYDTVGCNHSVDINQKVFAHYPLYPPPPHYSGNFWWANSNYLKNLPTLSLNELDATTETLNLFLSIKEHHERMKTWDIEKKKMFISLGGSCARVAPEFWLFQNVPNYYNMHSSNVIHGHIPYPRSGYTSKPNPITTETFLEFISLNKIGVEIGGPSSTGYILYKNSKNIDNVIFSKNTIWSESTDEYNYYPNKKGKVIVNDAVNIHLVENECYDFVFSSHSLEHIANPLKAVSEWLRITKKGGYVIIIVPEKSECFDHKRSYSKFSTLLSQYEKDVGEDDLSTLPEILANHDLSLDPPAGDFDNFKKRSLDNFNNRCLHHYVYDDELLMQICKHFKSKFIHKETCGMNRWFIMQKIVSNPVPDQVSA